LNKITSICKNYNIKYLLVYSATKNIDAIIKFYRNQGFESWYIQMFKKLHKYILRFYATGDQNISKT